MVFMRAVQRDSGECAETRLVKSGVATGNRTLYAGGMTSTDHVALLEQIIALSSVEATATRLRVAPSTVHRWRHSERSIPGPAQIVIEQMAASDGVGDFSRK